VLPALLNKLKEMIGLDLGGGSGSSKRRLEQPASMAAAAAGGQQPTRASTESNAPSTSGGYGSS
jgi:hypothetical protein